MSAGTFKITEHTVPACHIREYPGSTAKSQEEALSLHVKQYTPLDQHGPVPSDAVTVIAAHACGFPKELYEPLWDEIHHRLKRKGLHIRSIWIADAANMGMSGVLNEDKISNEYSWNDSARDLLMLINHFREQMPRPLVGIGHSFGGNILTNLALMHPRLLTTVVLLDPVIQTAGADRGIGTDPPGAVNYTLWRPDRWPNRKAAASAHAKIWQRWDRRCVDRMIKFGFRDLPTALYPEMPGGSDRSDPPVTLTTTKYQEATSLYRANFFAAHASDGRIPIDRSVHPDLDPVFAFQPVFRPESRMIALRLPTLRPPVLWILGEESFLGIDNIRASVQTCGTGVGGSGGVSQGQVKEIILSGCGHLLPFEAVDQTADHCADWIVQEIGKYGELERVWNQHRQSMSQRDHVVLGADWFELVKMPKALQRTSRAGKL
ncbi:Alpha/beta hydrolase family-domain-containing protein [Aspergillus coremiiformis]|uniref:Alpha/beta hydrolase family-domain-containing protein n=1 Tax=Aspergillus coremiiformis TaxID=138285 RepID=A0A5N6Z7P7_9EURO|nr:Alpha/beta hydrolase family-domain-containing protein [Aspergillus coremiiformis]